MASVSEKSSDLPSDMVHTVELEVLEAIYMDELTVEKDENDWPHTISILLHPATAMDTSKMYVCMTLCFHIPPDYPESVPDIVVKNPRGLGEEELQRLTEEMNELAQMRRGEHMLFDMIEKAKEHLTEGNIPSCECTICLEQFASGDSFMKTNCYHYFHTACLARYAVACMAKTEETEQESAPLHSAKDDSSLENALLCPMCRGPLECDMMSLLAEPIPEEPQEIFFLTPDVVQQQQEREALYIKQKAQGGIIDPEHEKNKFLVDENTVVSLDSLSKSQEKELSEGNAPTSENSHQSSSQSQLRKHSAPANDHRRGKGDNPRGSRSNNPSAEQHHGKSRTHKDSDYSKNSRNRGKDHRYQKTHWDSTRDDRGPRVDERRMPKGNMDHDRKYRDDGENIECDRYDSYDDRANVENLQGRRREECRGTGEKRTDDALLDLERQDRDEREGDRRYKNSHRGRGDTGRREPRGRGGYRNSATHNRPDSKTDYDGDNRTGPARETDHGQSGRTYRNRSYQNHHRPRDSYSEGNTKYSPREEKCGTESELQESPREGNRDSRPQGSCNRVETSSQGEDLGQDRSQQSDDGREGNHPHAGRDSKYGSRRGNREMHGHGNPRRGGHYGSRSQREGKLQSIRCWLDIKSERSRKDGNQQKDDRFDLEMPQNVSEKESQNYDDGESPDWHSHRGKSGRFESGDEPRGNRTFFRGQGRREGRGGRGRNRGPQFVSDANSSSHRIQESGHNSLTLDDPDWPAENVTDGCSEDSKPVPSKAQHSKGSRRPARSAGKDGRREECSNSVEDKKDAETGKALSNTHHNHKGHKFHQRHRHWKGTDARDGDSLSARSHNSSDSKLSAEKSPPGLAPPDPPPGFRDRDRAAEVPQRGGFSAVGRVSPPPGFAHS